MPSLRPGVSLTVSVSTGSRQSGSVIIACASLTRGRISISEKVQSLVNHNRRRFRVGANGSVQPRTTLHNPVHIMQILNNISKITALEPESLSYASVFKARRAVFTTALSGVVLPLIGLARCEWSTAIEDKAVI